MDISTSAVIGGSYRRDTISAPIAAAAPSAVRPQLTTAVAAAGRGERSALDSDRRFREPRDKHRDGIEDTDALRPDPTPEVAVATSEPSSGTDDTHRAVYQKDANRELSGVLGRADDEERLMHFPPESLVRYLEAVAERKEALAPARLDRKVDTRV
jgi:hypothetical protein